MEDSQAWLEVLLQKNHEENSVAKVLSIDAKPATKKGDNYMSEIKRIKMDIILKSGKKLKKSIIVKGLPPTEYHQGMIKDMSMFIREITVYRDIIPKMEEVLLEYGDYTEPMWATLINYRANDILIFDDLVEKGYKMGNRKEGLDLDHTLLVMRSLAKFHASSIVVKERGFISTDLFNKHIFQLESSKDMMQDFYVQALKNLVETMESQWEPEWQPTIKKIKCDIMPRVVDLVLEKIAFNEKRFNVLNHGDCWTNNMMFKYGLDSKTPISVKFVDLQICYYSSPAYDLQYFLSTSLSLDVRKRSLEHAIKVYHETLTKQLKLYSYKGHITTFEELMEDYRNTDIFGLMTAITLIPVVYREENDESFPEIEQMLKEVKNNEKLVLPGCNHPMYTAVIKEMLNRINENKSL